MSDTNTAVARRDEQDAPANMLAIIARAASDPSVDVEKMAALLDMQERIEARNAQRDYIEAEAAMQQAMPVIGKRGEIKNRHGQVQSRYARWEDIHAVIMPILHRHGFTLTFEIDTEGKIAVQAVLSHASGHVKKSGFMTVPRDESGAKNPTQGAGSSVSYAKRYATLAVLNIATEGEDDDGQTRSERAATMSLLEEKASEAAGKGTAAYQDFFTTKITAEDRRILADSGKHDEFKAKAAAVDQGEPGDPEF